MGIAIAIVGGIAAAIAFLTAVTLEPSTAPQQAVEALRYVVTMLGLILVALGCAVHQIEALRQRLAPPAEMLAPDPPLPLAVGSRVMHNNAGGGIIRSIDGEEATVEFYAGDLRAAVPLATLRQW